MSVREAERVEEAEQVRMVGEETAVAQAVVVVVENTVVAGEAQERSLAPALLGRRCAVI